MRSEETQSAPTSLVRACVVIFLLSVFPFTSAAQTLTAAEAIARIQKHYAVPVPHDTVDTIKAGDPSTPVTGIATTFLDTMDVLREAQRRGLNLVISHEPTFYNHLDDAAFFASDPVYREKLAFIQQHHMVVFRFHDQMHGVSPDPVAVGLVQAMGWQNYMNDGNPFQLTIPRTTLLGLSRELAKRLNAPTLRIVGNPDLPITHVALLPGAAGSQKQILVLRSDEVEVLLAGEVPEWETVEYVRDASAQGRHKALILLGHAVSEEAGMKQYAEDLRALFPNVKVQFVAAGQPTWNPDHPPAGATTKAPAK
ncbi:MAG TPA: Nif3-like dinuclear metal center hexameric protein [Terriglobales bacterium]